jgi:hypothetical protein
MRKLAIATLLVASCTLASAQESTGQKDTGDKSGNWFTRTFSFGGKPDTDKTAAADKKKTEPAPVADSAAVKLAREAQNLKRRNQVCLKLREIAIQTRDQALMDQVDGLEQRVLDLYLQRTGELPDSDGALDAQILEKNLGSGAPSARPANRPVHSISGSNSSVREDK